MHLIIFLLIFGTLNYHPVNLKVNWCALKCGSQKNIVCKRKSYCGLESGCKGKESKLTQAQIDAVVDAHNRLRSDLATGKETRGGASKVADMSVISYHKELEYTAQCLSNTCKFQHWCGKGPSVGHAGQNIFQENGDISESKIDSMCKGWWSEIEKADASIFKSFHNFQVVGHFTQMAWAKTEYVGCGATRKGGQLLFVCNYSPAGNMARAPVYTEGEPCSKCPADKPCNKKYPGLCGEVNNKMDFNGCPPISAIKYAWILPILNTICALKYN